MLITALSILLFGLCMFLAFFYTKIRRLRKMTGLVPGPKTIPFFGNALEIGMNIAALMPYLEMTYSKYKPVYCIWFLHHLLVFINSKEDRKNLLSGNKVMRKAYPYEYMMPHLGAGLVTSVGDRWQNDRKKITPVFHYSVLKKYMNTHIKKTDDLVKKLAKYADGHEFDISPLTVYCAGDSILTTSISMDIDESVVKQLLAMIRSGEQRAMYRLQHPWFGSDFLYRLSSKGRTDSQSIRETYRIMKGFMDKREKTSAADRDTRHSLLDVLLDMKNKNIITERDAVQQLSTVLAAGSDTSGACISITCWLLSRHPEIQENAVTELGEIFGDSDRPASYEDLVQMKYLERVIKESLRLYPVVPLIGRKLEEDYKTENYTLPAGADLFVFIWGIHRDPKYFPDPDKYDPDRFLSTNLVDKDDFCYLPFSRGPRNCIGQKYAMQLLKITISGILRKYKLLPGSVPLELNLEIALHSKTGIILRLDKR